MTSAESCNVLPPVPSLRKIELSVEPVPPPMVPVAVAVIVVPEIDSPDPASKYRSLDSESSQKTKRSAPASSALIVPDVTDNTSAVDASTLTFNGNG
jgi:hypothetical protein